MQSIWKFVKRPVIAELLSLGVLIGAGLAMDRWYRYVFPLMRAMRTNEWATFFPLIGWSMLLMLFAVGAASLEPLRRRMATAACMIIGVIATTTSLSIAPHWGRTDWISETFPGYSQWFITNGMRMHVMSFDLAAELLWIGLAVWIVSVLARRLHVTGEIRPIAGSVVVSLGLLVLGHLLISILLPMSTGPDGLQDAGWLIRHRFELTEAVASITSLGIWIAVLVGVRRSRWTALPWLLIGTVLGMFFLFTDSSALRSSDSLRDLHFFFMRTYGFDYPILIARLLAIGILGFAFGPRLACWIRGGQE